MTGNAASRIEAELPGAAPAPLRPAPASVLADVRAGLIVFLVALPLCLGVAAASGAPPLAGLIAGIVGGSVVALASGSPLSVAGPAAGLTVIVADGITNLTLPTFLLATVLAGGIQVAMGVLGLGRAAQLVPNAVIRGMLAAIGLILLLKQLPHALGYDADFEGDFEFSQRDGHNTFSELFYSLRYFHLGAVATALCSTLAFVGWRDYPRLALRRYLPRELVAVLAGLACSFVFVGTGLELAPEHRVRIPVLSDGTGLSALWTSPDFAAITRPEVWRLAFTLAIVASIESLLCIEATERLDPLRRITSPRRELVAQGLGNAVSGTLGGLPVTAVVVRSFANVQAGARTRWSSFTHGVLLAATTLTLGSLLNRIPLASLAVVLIAVGYKLTPPRLYREVYQLGREQFLPFVMTVVFILLTDLLIGTLLGIGFAIFFIVYGHYSSAIVVTDDGPYRLVRFVANVSFLHKARLKDAFASMPNGGHLVLDGTRARHVDIDVIEAIRDLCQDAERRGVTVSIQRSGSALHPYFREEGSA